MVSRVTTAAEKVLRFLEETRIQILTSDRYKDSSPIPRVLSSTKMRSTKGVRTNLSYLFLQRENVGRVRAHANFPESKTTIITTDICKYRKPCHRISLMSGMADVLYDQGLLSHKDYEYLTSLVLNNKPVSPLSVELRGFVDKSREMFSNYLSEFYSINSGEHKLADTTDSGMASGGVKPEDPGQVDPRKFYLSYRRDPATFLRSEIKMGSKSVLLTSKVRDRMFYIEADYFENGNYKRSSRKEIVPVAGDFISSPNDEEDVITEKMVTAIEALGCFSQEDRSLLRELTVGRFCFATETAIQTSWALYRAYNNFLESSSGGIICRFPLIAPSRQVVVGIEADLIDKDTGKLQTRILEEVEDDSSFNAGLVCRSWDELVTECKDGPGKGCTLINLLYSLDEVAPPLEKVFERTCDLIVGRYDVRL